MNTIKEHILKEKCCLYRYDIVKPPIEWVTDYKNPEYVYPDNGIKNQIGAFFFFNSADYALLTGKYAIEKQKDNYYNGIWITKCTIKESIKLLDLRDSFFCIELLAALDKAGFAIFVDELKSWEGRSFSELKSIIQPVADILLNETNPVDNEKVRNAIKETYNVLKIQNIHIGHLEQMFTDYSNGYYFRKMLQDKGFEGYIFNETNALNFIGGSDTICIFESTKFLPPNVLNIPLFTNG